MPIDFEEYRVSSDARYCDDAFNQYVKDNFCAHVENRFEDLLPRCICPKCERSPSTTWSNEVLVPIEIVRFHCDTCQLFWNTCKVCSTSECDKDFKPVSKRVPRRGRVQILDSQVESHMSRLHSHDITDFEVNADRIGDEPVEMELDTLGTDVNDDVLFSFQTALDAMFPDSDTSIHMHHLKEAVYHRETSKKYSHFHITKYWMKTSQCDLPRNDVKLFLRLVRLMMLCSRDDLVDLSFVVDSLMKSKEKERCRLNAKVARLKSQLQSAVDAIRSLEVVVECNEITNCDVDFKELYQTLDTQSSISVSSIQLDDSIVDVPMPRSVQMMRQILESKAGFVSSCVIPQIHLHASGCAYVLPSDVLKMAICLGVPLEHVIGKNYDVNVLHHRSIYRCSSIRNRIASSDIPDSGLSVALGYWSDGCICGTDSKGGRSSAKTITIHIPHPKMSIRHVFPVCFGRKNDDSTDVLKILLDDIETMSNTPMTCYVPSLKKIATVHIILGYALQDRPEHSETTSFMSSGGIFSKRVGVSCPVVVKRTGMSSGQTDINTSDETDMCEKRLASCEDCHKRRIDKFCSGELQTASSSYLRCARCYDWDMVAVKFKPHMYYPNDMLPSQNQQDMERSDGMEYVLQGKRVTFHSMKYACGIIFSKVLNNEWSLRNAEQYARVECIRHVTWKRVYVKAVSLRGTENEDENITMPDDVLPPFWNQDVIKLDGVHLGVMHYLFLNVGSHLMTCIKDKLRGNTWKHVYDLWNDILKDVRAMSLSWCKCWTLGSKDKPASVWVSENYVGFSMICKTLALSLRSLEMISEDMTVIESACNAYYCLVSYVMSPNIPSEEEILAVGALSKIFLTTIQELDNSVYKERHENKIETASCFVNLLSLSEKMESFGIVRNYWEGGIRGEGIFLWLKRIVKRGLHNPAVARTILTKLYKAQSLEDMIRFEDNEESYISYVQSETNNTSEEDVVEDDPLFNTERYRRFHAYKVIEDIETKLDEKKPVAVVNYVRGTRDNQFFIMLGRNKKKKEVVKVVFHDMRMQFNTKTFDAYLDGEPFDISDLSECASDFLSCLLVPMYDKNTTNVNGVEEVELLRQYYLISEDHKEFGRGLRFVFPNMNKPQDTGDPNADTNMNETELTPEDITFCQDRTKCMSLIDLEVNEVEGCEFGKVKKFRYKNSIAIAVNALWTISYYETRLQTRSKKNIDVTFATLKDVLKDPIEV